MVEYLRSPLPTSDPYVEVLTPSVAVFGDGASKEGSKVK